MRAVFRFVNLTVLCVFACVLFFNVLVGQAMATGEFSKTCEDIILNGSVLSAFCEKADGYTLQQTEIDLDEYIGNLDGTLAWGDHDFEQTCNSIGLGQSFLTRHYTLNSNCERADQQSYLSSEIDLDAHIANINGTLSFE